jgi:tetratricopeptide (TPR) repeat protein
MLAACAIAGRVAQAAEGASTSRWLDVESRIQYAYYTEDRRALASIAETLATDTTQGGERPYYLALASYRLAELAGVDHPDEMRKPAERCASSLDRAPSGGPGTAERLALEATCLRVLAELEPLRAPYLGMKSGSAMRKAVQLAPRDPRVLLLNALADRDHQRDPQEVIGELQRAVAAFELERQGIERTPGWGAAEAYTFLGRSLLERGQALAARGALEHALLLVPDFALAHRLMARITAG